MKRSGREARWRRGRSSPKRPLDIPRSEEAETVAPRPSEPAEEAQPPRPEAASTPPPKPAPREWNLWDLERRARAYAGESARDEEWTALFVHLRRFADTAGQLPKEFDSLVRESFAELIQAA